jgi:hypothetical protein
MYNYRPDFNLFQDNYAGLWIKDYALANAKVMLGEAREKFATIAGPQGGTSLNGATLKAEGAAMIEKLDLELTNNYDNQRPMTFVIG